MNNLYLIGGSPRSGKTIIFNAFLAKKPMVAINSDALREGVRQAIVEESGITINELAITGDVTFHRSGENKDISHNKHFSYQITQEELTWKTLVGLIMYYDKQNIPVLIEGMAITPERIKYLELENLKVKTVFLGYLDNSQFDSVLEYANQHKDWMYKKINQENNGDDTTVRKWFEEEVEKNKVIAANANEFGYKFFSPSAGSFEEYTDTVVRYLLDEGQEN
ncbi:MAG: hypothetical protein JWN90_284 [Parcubacteria group bacterium]|nr:hypothetical protein [Parcubacteria group bacterium]